MESEKNLLDWLQWPLLIVIIVTPLRFALEVAGLSGWIMAFFSSTAFVFALAVIVGASMAGQSDNRVSRLFAVGFSLGYVNGFMTLIATLLSTYASIETHYRHHSLEMSDAEHIFLWHLIVLPLVTSLVASVLACLAFVIAQKVKSFRENPQSSSEDHS